MTEIPKQDNGNYSWVEYRRLVLSKINSAETDRKEIKKDVKEIKAEQVEIKLNIKGLQTKATIWGGFAGFIVGGVITFIGWVFF